MEQTTEQEPDFSDLFQDSDLLQVFWRSPSVLENLFNRWCTGVTVGTLTSFALIRHFAEPNIPHPAFAEMFLAWSTVGWTLASALLGFLIAGFALLCTVFRPGTVKRLHEIVQDGEKNNVLRNLFIFFVDVFIQFLALLLVSLFVQILFIKGGPSYEIVKWSAWINPALPELEGYLVFIAWGTWFVVLTLKLKSFVYNLYQSLLLGMVDGVHNPES